MLRAGFCKCLQKSFIKKYQPIYWRHASGHRFLILVLSESIFELPKIFVCFLIDIDSFRKNDTIVRIYVTLTKLDLIVPYHECKILIPFAASIHKICFCLLN